MDLNDVATVTLVSVLQNLAAAEIASIRHSRDFRRLSIFDFFNSIGAKRPFIRKRHPATDKE